LISAIPFYIQYGNKGEENAKYFVEVPGDTLAHGRTFRVVTIVDEHTRECLAEGTGSL
jgi:hypothetical protein